ncbi:hypothetical protein PGTUg99_004572 [Puccinia graminis f. sp. tritici]|uniref:Uncharacterized protein n=1 Tax=Puccinia graminis f. sp. tritici TaxID=56615 RepID=A0A5B0RQV9_PUCGR|nr:hypothetical protein PGTUg99_004572 [Puccinia graminis f. sp. tritici]
MACLIPELVGYCFRTDPCFPFRLFGPAGGPNRQLISPGSSGSPLPPSRMITPSPRQANLTQVTRSEGLVYKPAWRKVPLAKRASFRPALCRGNLRDIPFMYVLDVGLALDRVLDLFYALAPMIICANGTPSLGCQTGRPRGAAPSQCDWWQRWSYKEPALCDAGGKSSNK